MSEQAIRHPKRGKAHAYWNHNHCDVWTICGRPTDAMTERIDVERTAPEDRCKRCWPKSEAAA